MTGDDFLRAIDARPLTALERAIALLWWAGSEDPTEGLTAKDICAMLERSGAPKQNASRLEVGLANDRRTARAGRGAWRLHPRTRRELDAEYGFARAPMPLPASDSMLPREMFADTRGYIVRVVDQVNKSYDGQLWDCCAVMCRRLLETMIIELYEGLGRAADIKGSDGHFMMLNGLLGILEKDTSIHLGRNASRGLKDFKQLGDLSAHNRRFNATRNDLDRIRDGLRVAAEELLHLAGLHAQAI